MANAALRAHARELVLETITEIARAEHAGDEFECLYANDCANPGGHVYFTSCGETKCLYCPKVAWR